MIGSALLPQNLTLGMKVWGIVLEVAPRGLTISMPHGLRGHVAPEEVRCWGEWGQEVKRGGRAGVLGGRQSNTWGGGVCVEGEAKEGGRS